MRDIDLKELMKSLYVKNKYFAEIEPEFVQDFEEAYHKQAIDPDGNIRQLMSPEERDFKLQNFLKEYIDELEQLPGGKILDIGCGPGWLLSHLGKEWDKHGIEISKFASTHALKFGQIHCGTLEDFNNSDNFDVITMNHVIEHVSDPISIINKINSLLKSNGVLIIGTPDFDSAMARRYGNQYRMLHDSTHVSLFSVDSMHRFLRDHGFKIYKVEFPFFDTAWFNKDNLMKVLNQETMSPPFYGSIMTFFCRKT